MFLSKEGRIQPSHWLSCLQNCSACPNELNFFGILVYSLVSQPADLLSLAISGRVLTEAKLPGFKMCMELVQTAKATQAPKPYAFTRSLENENGHDTIKGPPSFD